MIKVFETKNGVELFFDEDNYTYESSNIEEVKNSLLANMDAYEVDADAAIMAHNLMTMIEDMERYKELSKFVKS